MDTPIIDFVNDYIKSGTTRFHMPGHKGVSFLGFEAFDITEIGGADDLSCPDGIIKQSEENAAQLFGTKATLYSTGGSSQSINAMLHLAYINRKDTTSTPIVLAARNAHKAFIFAAAKIGFEIEWLYPEESHSLCSAPITADSVKFALQNMKNKPFAVYITTPDYLGGIADTRAIAEVCHELDIPLLVDNAHGAYSAFTDESFHPILTGADMCCDSAHKTLPAITGCGYLHIAKDDKYGFCKNAKEVMTIYGTSSPSYLMLCSLDKCNEYICTDLKVHLNECKNKVDKVTEALAKKGLANASEEPVKITVDFSDVDKNGFDFAEHFRKHSIEFEYADDDFVVLMITGFNSDEDFDRLLNTIDTLPLFEKSNTAQKMNIIKGTAKMSVREAIFSRSTAIPVEQAEDRICGTPTVSCPPAIPIVVSGEKITKEHIKLLKKYGKDHINVVDNNF